jgi:hypothetical protein
MTSFIIATKDLIKGGRGIDRLYWQVLSLQGQGEVIIMDGSSYPEFHQITKRLHNLSVRLYHRPQAVLNLPALWNEGVRLAVGEWIHISGADFIYHPGFLKAVEEVRNPNRLVMCKVWELPRMTIKASNVAEWKWPTLREFFPAKPRLANGIQHGTKALFEAVPYDERMEKLGGMDNLQEYKCSKAGYDCFWWEQQMVLHQWHKVSQLKADKQFNRNQQIIKDYLS